jgi:hypothetical protein
MEKLFLGSLPASLERTGKSLALLGELRATNETELRRVHVHRLPDSLDNIDKGDLLLFLQPKRKPLNAANQHREDPFSKPQMQPLPDSPRSPVPR